MPGGLFWLCLLGSYQIAYDTAKDKRQYLSTLNTARELLYVSAGMDRTDPVLLAELANSFANRVQLYDREISLDNLETLHALCDSVTRRKLQTEFSRSALKEELCQRMFHPRNMDKWSDWGFD